MYVHQSRFTRGWWSFISYQLDRSPMFFLNPNDTAALALMWIVPSPPLPEPAKLCALTHRPRHWWVARFLAYAGNGIAMP
jgi:hypothetical protein